MTKIDQHIGAKVREMRELRGLTQTQAGEMLGVSFQQFQKYERGTNRISAGALWTLAHKTAVPMSFFFVGAPAP